MEDLDRWLAASALRRWGLVVFLGLWLGGELWLAGPSFWSLLVAALLVFVLWRIARLGSLRPSGRG